MYNGHFTCKIFYSVKMPKFGQKNVTGLENEQ